MAEEQAETTYDNELTNNERVAKMRLRQAKLHISIGVGIIVLLAAFLFVAAALLLSPYHPMIIYSYTPEIEEACPNTVVPVLVDYEVVPDAKIDSMEIRAGWEAVDVPGYSIGTRVFNVRSNFNAPDDYFDSGRFQRETRAPRVSPNVAGEWVPVSETTVRGYSYGVPHVQVIKTAQHSGDQTITILSPDSAKCK